MSLYTIDNLLALFEKAVPKFKVTKIKCNSDRTLCSVLNVVSELTDIGYESLRKNLLVKMKEHPLYRIGGLPLHFI